MAQAGDLSNPQETTAVVPFGKYKNQPLEILASDKAYCEWLSQQGWLAERYPALRTVIINHFAEPSETPAHNALQLQFLDEDLRTKVSYCGMLTFRPYRECFHAQHYLPLLARISQPTFEKEGIDVWWRLALWVPYFEHVYGVLPHGKPGWTWREYEVDFLVECKPTLGDDYPAVLRFMHSLNKAGIKIVLTEACTFRGGTLTQVQQMFIASGVLLLEMEGIANLPGVALCGENDLPDASLYEPFRIDGRMLISKEEPQE